METSTIRIQYDSEKLRMLKRYTRDEAGLPTVLEAYLQTLYERHVPAEVRKSIDM